MLGKAIGPCVLDVSSTILFYMSRNIPETFPKPGCFLDNPLSTLHNCLEPGHYLDNLLATLFQNSPLILVHVELLTEGFLSEILRKGTSFGKKSLILLVETIHQQIGKM